MSEVRPSSSPNAPSTGHADAVRPPLGKALKQSAVVQEKIAGVGDELLVINTVLKQEIPEPLQSGEVAQALEKSDALETKVQECVDDLAEVNEALEEEVNQRQKLEQQLARSQAELAKTRTDDTAGKA